jgi:hypothetical protein
VGEAVGMNYIGALGALGAAFVTVGSVQMVGAGILGMFGAPVHRWLIAAAVMICVGAFLLGATS